MKLTQAILPVAGLGTRFLPWTKAVPKEMLPLGTEPIIAKVVHECLDCGIEDICFVISKGKECIPAYFYEDAALEQELERRGKKDLLSELQRYDSVNFHVVYQDEQHGDGHALLQAADWIKSDHIGVLFGDDLFTGADVALLQLQRAATGLGDDFDGAIVSLENVDRNAVSKYGIVDVESEDGRLKKLASMVEKPDPKDAPSTLGIVGRYIIPSATFDVLAQIEGDHANEIRLIDALIQQLESVSIYGYECEGTRLDTGNPEGYREAVEVLG